jgi:hypothetical protein
MAPDGATQVKPAWACALKGADHESRGPRPPHRCRTGALRSRAYGGRRTLWRPIVRSGCWGGTGENTRLQLRLGNEKDWAARLRSLLMCRTSENSVKAKFAESTFYEVG